MILHAASIAAFFVDQLTQTPVQIQCVQQSMPESWLKSLLPTIVQTVISLTSIAAGVCIAVASFRANKKTEHEKWIRDQKKAEWKELLIKVAGIEEIIPIISTGLPDYKPLENAVLAILPLLRSNIFIHSALESKGFIGQWESYAQFVSGEFEARIKGDNDIQRSLVDVELTMEDRTNSDQLRQSAELKVRAQFHDLRNKLRTLAQKELEN
ncbi:MAG: hypothetical protein WCF54_06770 [Terracidiphilus sp.]